MRRRTYGRLIDHREISFVWMEEERDWSIVARDQFLV